MDDRDLEKLIDQDDQLGSHPNRFGASPDAELEADTHHEADTNVDEGLELLHRVRNQWPEWPANDDGLDATPDLADPGELQWGSSRRPPRTLGRFEVRGELGRGGFGVVLLAHDPKLEQEVALKIPRAETMLSSDARVRMAREARAATILSHPAIVPVYETGDLAGIPYISYGYCPGESLAEWLAARGGSVAPRLAAAIVARLAEALQHAHARSIIHRDLKPSNVLLDDVSESRVSKRGGESTDDELLHHAIVDSLRVADFGLARVAEGRSDLTRSGTPLGTPTYMSPEQARGETEIYPATDVFSLGVLLYELLAGSTPFRRETDIATMRAIESDVPQRIRAGKAGVPKDLEAICLKCLEKQPQDRYETAQALHDDLNRFWQGHPVMARPVRPLIQFARWCDRNRALTAVSLLAVSFLLSGFVTSAALWRRAEQKAGDALRHAQHSRAAVQSLLNAIANEPSLERENMEQFRQQLHEAASNYYAKIKDEQPDAPELIQEYVQSLRGLAKMNRLLGDHDEAANICSTAAGLAAQLPAEISVKTTAALAMDRAKSLAMLGRHEDAFRETERAIEIFEIASQSNDIENLKLGLIDSLGNATGVLVGQGQFERAASFVDRALAAGEQLTGHIPSEWSKLPHSNRSIALAKALRAKSEVCYGLKQLDALPSFAQATIGAFESIRQHDVSKESMCFDSMATMHYLLGNMHLDQENWDAAENEFRLQREAIECLVAQHADVGFVYLELVNNGYHLAQLEHDRENYSDALKSTKHQLAEVANYKSKFPNLRLNFQKNEIDLLVLRSQLKRLSEEPGQAHADLETAIMLCEEVCAVPQPSGTWLETLAALKADLKTIEIE
jgi:serine/threonine protein kinase